MLPVVVVVADFKADLTRRRWRHRDVDVAGGRAEVAGPGRATSAVEWRVVEKCRRSRRLVR